MKRLSGANGASQDDFQKPIGVFLVNFDVVPKTKFAEIKSVIGKYKLDKVEAKITSKVAQKDGKWHAGDIALENPKEGDLLKEVGEKAGALWVLSGVLTEDDKGSRTLTLAKAEQAKK